MGYDSTFDGHFTIDPPLNHAEFSYLISFNDSRRVTWHDGRSGAPLKVSGGPGAYNDRQLADHNRPPPGQPGLWCKWTPMGPDRDMIEWDGNEKFYDSAEWIAYLIDHLLGPKARPFIDLHVGEDKRLADFTCDHVVNGIVYVQGEDDNDTWRIVVKDNVVTAESATTVWPETVGEAEVSLVKVRSTADDTLIHVAVCGSWDRDGEAITSIFAERQAKGEVVIEFEKTLIRSTFNTVKETS